MISALLGKTNDPKNVPMKNDEPMYPSSFSVVHYKLYYKIQLWMDLLSDQSILYLTSGLISPGIDKHIYSFVQIYLSIFPGRMQV